MNPIAIAAGAAVALYLLTRPRASLVPNVAVPALARQLAAKWAPLFGIPADLLLVIGKLESGYRSRAHNPAAARQGGAWGMFQQTLDTAKSNVAQLQKDSRAEVRAVVARFRGRGEDLWDPELNAVLASYQLGKLWKRYGGRFEHVVAAYHQGAGNVDKFLRQGRRFPDDLPPNGKVYVTRALAVRSGGSYA